MLVRLSYTHIPIHLHLEESANLNNPQDVSPRLVLVPSCKHRICLVGTYSKKSEHNYYTFTASCSCIGYNNFLYVQHNVNIDNFIAKNRIPTVKAERYDFGRKRSFLFQHTCIGYKQLYAQTAIPNVFFNFVRLSPLQKPPPISTYAVNAGTK